MSVLVGKPAPDFAQPALWADGSIAILSLSEVCRGRACVLWFYAHDFEDHCGSALQALNQHIDAFARHNTLLVSVSVDSPQAHRAWCDLATGSGGVGHLPFPMVSDQLHEVSRDYDVLAANGTSLNAVFVIDAIGMVRFQSVSELAAPVKAADLLELVAALNRPCS